MMLKKKLQEVFHTKDLVGKLRFFLGLEVLYLPQGIHLSQRKYVLDTLKEYGFLGCKPSSILMDRSSVTYGWKGLISNERSNTIQKIDRKVDRYTY